MATDLVSPADYMMLPMGAIRPMVRMSAGEKDDCSIRAAVLCAERTFTAHLWPALAPAAGSSRSVVARVGVAPPIWDRRSMRGPATRK